MPNIRAHISVCMCAHMHTDLLIKHLLAHPLQAINKRLAFVVILHSTGAAGVATINFNLGGVLL